MSSDDLGATGGAHPLDEILFPVVDGDIGTQVGTHRELRRSRR